MITRDLIERLLGYSVVGGLAFLVDASLTLYLAQKLHYIVANTTGFVVANLFNFFISHGFVFKKSYHWQELLRAYPAVLTISSIGLLLSDSFIFLFVEIMDSNLMLAKIVTTVLVLGWNFIVRIHTVYKFA